MRARSTSRATPRTASSAASTSTTTSRGDRARDAADPRDLRRRAGPVTDAIGDAARAQAGAHAQRARAEAARHRRCAATRSRDIFTRLRFRFERERRRLRRHAAVLPLRPRDRGGPDRGGRAHPRLRQHSGDAAPRTCRRCCRAPEARRSAHALRARLAARDYQEVINFSFVESATGARARRRRREPDRGAESDRRQLESCARRCWPASSTMLQTNLEPQACRACACSRSAACSARRSGGLRAAAAHRRPRVRRRRAPEQWGAAHARRRFLRREGRPRSACRAAAVARPSAAPHPALHPGRGAPRADRRRAVGLARRAASALAAEVRAAAAPVVFELDLAALHGSAGARRAQRCPGSPSVRRDIAVVVDEDSAGAGDAGRCSRPPSRRIVDELCAVRPLPRARAAERQKKPCDSGGYARY